MLTFGTAGLRGQLGPGDSQMNVATVTRVTAGLMAWLTAHVDNPQVVIGCDGRHGSTEFYQATAQVVAAAGGRALCLPQSHPTPLTAFSVKHLHADAGVMITASHNPATDNGYKVYLGGRIATGPAAGVQLIPPADSDIATAIARTPAADQVPCASRDDPGIIHVDTRDAYRQAARDLNAALTGDGKAAHTEFTIALTAMHGVGGALAEQVLTDAGFTVSMVAEQATPDPDFPTVAFPNPEEPGALDLAIAHATAIDADLIMALDPDADRLAVAIPDSQSTDGWRQLTGDETGCLLADYLIQRGVITPGSTVASSIVSSRQLSAIAAAHGINYQATLTGFKWIARTPGLSFGYEEAIGYCCNPATVADKDGITAALTFAHLAGDLSANRHTVQFALDRLATTYGHYATAPLTLRVEDPAIIATAMARLRATPPQRLAGSPVTTVVDFLNADANTVPGRTDAIMAVTAHDDRVIIRPSGTEPKLKCYLEVIAPPGDPTAQQNTADRLNWLRRDVAALLDAPR